MLSSKAHVADSRHPHPQLSEEKKEMFEFMSNQTKYLSVILSQNIFNLYMIIILIASLKFKFKYCVNS